MKFKLFNYPRKPLLFLTFILLIFGASSCGGGDVECPDLSINDDIVESEIIEQYHTMYFPTNTKSESVDRIGVYIDLSDGITKYCLGNENNKKVYKKFLTSISNKVDNTDYFELSNDSVIKYSNSNIIDYFTGSGFKLNGKLKTGAPLDQAINRIADNDNVGVLITDGELYDKSAGKVSKEMWASKAFTKWFNKGNKLEIVYTDFTENNKGKEYNKHMFIMFFIPKNATNKVYENYLEDLKEDKITYKTMSFSTNISEMYEREYKNAQLPGADKYLEDFTEVNSFFPSNNYAMEFIDFSDIAPFSINDDGLVYYLRDVGDENGNKMNYPLIDKLFFHFDKLQNYDVNKIKIVVHDVYDDFENYKKNLLARQNPPIVVKNTKGKDSLTVENYLVFDCLTTIDGYEPYDIDMKSQQDTTNNFTSLLNQSFRYKKGDFSSSDLGVQDFLFLDQTAGEVNEVNDSGKYEIVLKFHEQLNEATKGLNIERKNLFRVDVILEEAIVDDESINTDALTWDKIDESGKDEALYTSLRNTMSENIPTGVIYSYYLKFEPFNQ